MKILAIDTSAKAASCAICEDGKLLAECFQNNGLTHSKTIMPLIENMLSCCNEKIENIDKIAVAAGPGSFTGLRIGVSAAKGMSWASGIPVCGVSTLEAMAWQFSFIKETLCVVMDARAGQVYNAIFKFENGELKRLCPDRAIALQDLLEELKGIGEIFLVGDGALLCYNEGINAGVSLSVPADAQLQSRASGVALASQNIQGDSAEKLEIFYHRLPQAERERLAKLNNK